MSVVEIYGTKPKADVLEAQQADLERAEEEAAKRVKDAEAIDMFALAQQDRVRVRNQAAKAYCDARELEPLSEGRVELWEAWLPTSYITGDRLRLDRKLGRGWCEWSSYQYYEGVPAHVRKLIAEVMPLFSRLEIRTPEEQPIVIMDPALFGWIEYPDGRAERYLLARWGESDANLVSEDDIALILAARKPWFPRWKEHHDARDRSTNVLESMFVGGLSMVAMMVVLALFIPAADEVQDGVSKGVAILAALGRYFVPQLDGWRVSVRRERLKAARPDLAAVV